MAYHAIRSSQEDRLECFLLSVRPSALFSFLRHDPRSAHWGALTPWLRHIYENKQRKTEAPRIAALNNYIINQMMDPQKIGALPPISVAQFQPFDTAGLTQVNGVGYQIEDSDSEVDRFLIDGLARVTAVQNVRERFQIENPLVYERFNNTFRFTVALYVPTAGRLSQDEIGQLFSDFNSYAWPVPAAITIANDIYNPYRSIARKVAESDFLRRYGGLKIGSSKLGKKDVNFTTEVTMAQFVKIVVEGEQGYGSFHKPVPDARISTVDQDAVALGIVNYLAGIEAAMGADRFRASQLLHAAHGLYALAVLLHDIGEGRTTPQQTIPAIAAIDWTWNNPDLQTGIGRNVGDGKGWKLNTGSQTIWWLVRHLRSRSGVVMPQQSSVAQAA